MCLGLRKSCTDSNTNSGHGIVGLAYNFILWHLPRVRWILTCTSYFLGLID
jgi:hypothetical protein